MNATRSEGTTAQLLRLCLGYFVFYVVTGVSVKYFQGSAAQGFPGMNGTSYLLYNTIGGNLLCLGIVLGRRWYRSPGPLGAFDVFVLALSGACTAVVIPATTLLYSLPISVMVAMVIMRGSIIIVRRGVDALLIAQKISHRRVYAEENLAVGFALTAVGMHLVGTEPGGFDFVANQTAVIILCSYIAAYAIRLYLMNWFKHRRAGRGALDERTYFAWEQIAATIVIAAVATGIYLGTPDPGSGVLGDFHAAIDRPHPIWYAGVLSGVPFGLVAFFSVFLFLFRGRTATFAGLVNRMTSLVAGTVATLMSAVLFGGRWPETNDWASLVFIGAAVACLAQAERRRKAEVALVATT